MSFKDRNKVPQEARVTGSRDVIASPNLLRWLVEGKIFEAGFGLEDAEENTQTTLDATKPQFMLQSPVSDEPIVVPILLKLMVSNDGGGITNYQVMFTKPAGLCATKMAFSSTQTAMTSKHNLYRTDPPQRAQQAGAYYADALTVSALVAADYVSYHFGHAINATLTSGLVALGEGPSNVHTFRFLQDGAPHLMTQGAAMLVWNYCGTSDGVVSCYMQWAEITLDDLV